MVIYTFWDATLKELRTNLGLCHKVVFTYYGLNITQSEEEYILIKEVQIGSFIYGIGQLAVVEVPTAPPAPSSAPNTKEAVAAAEIKVYNTDVIGKIGINGTGIPLDSFGNPNGT